MFNSTKLIWIKFSFIWFSCKGRLICTTQNTPPIIGHHISTLETLLSFSHSANVQLGALSFAFHLNHPNFQENNLNRWRRNVFISSKIVCYRNELIPRWFRQLSYQFESFISFLIWAPSKLPPFVILPLILETFCVKHSQSLLHTVLSTIIYTVSWH